jgi:hypothetical protein
VGWFTGDRALILFGGPRQPVLVVDFRQDQANVILDRQQLVPRGATFARFVATTGTLVDPRYVLTLTDEQTREDWLFSEPFARSSRMGPHSPTIGTIDIGFTDISRRPNGFAFTVHWHVNGGGSPERRINTYDVPQSVLDFVAGLTNDPHQELKI